ncbi:MAG TPA: hypothetical protein VHP63_01730, partial [candidate division Zixibacteria bacterium]|nr:hypothetical protein [candidate division Zixibacteria bacterium]
MSIYGIAYKGGLELSENGQLGFRISSAIFQSNGNTGMGSLTGKWFFEIAPSNGFVLERFGASETKGLFGGVKNEKQRLYSEATERVIGDIVTSQICRICGHAASVQNGSVILVLGPAFPKLVGRIASLRIQRSISVIFICPKPFPKWILAGVNETIILPQYGSKKVAPIDGWEDEAMVHGYETSLKGTQLVVQEITYWE